MTRIAVSENERTLVEQARSVEKLRAKVDKLTAELAAATTDLQLRRAEMIASIAETDSVEAKIVSREEIAAVDPTKKIVEGMTLAAVGS